MNQTNVLLLSSRMYKLSGEIKAYCEAERITAAEFGRRAGIKKGTLSLLMNDATDPSKMEAGTLRSISKLIGKPMEELLTGERSRAFEDAQLRNDVTALQIVARSVVKALNANMQVVAQDVADELFSDPVVKPEDPAVRPFAVDSGLLLQVLKILGRAVPGEEADGAPAKLSVSVR